MRRYIEIACCQSTYCRLKANSLLLTTERVGRGNDRLVAQPASRELAHAGTVLGRDIASRIQIGIEMIATLPTNENTLRTAVVAGGMPAAATSLRGMSRIDRNHRTTPFEGLVLDFRFEGGKRPRVHPALGCGAPLRLHPLTNIPEVFQNDRRARLGSSDDLLAEDVIGILAETSTTTFGLSQMSFGAFRVFLLQRAGQLEIAPFDRFPAS